MKKKQVANVFILVILFLAVSTLTCTAADSIFSDGFESGDTSGWNYTTAATALSVTAGAALDGTYSLALTPGTGTPPNEYVADQTPASETGYRARFLIDVNTILYTSGESLTVLQGVDSGGSVVFALRLVGSGTAGQVALQGRTYDDSSTTHESQPFALAAGSIPLGIEWHAASSSTSSDGQFLIFMNDAVAETLSDLDNDGRSVSEVRLGLIPITVSSAAGSYYVDWFESWRVTAASSTTTTIPDSGNTPPVASFTVSPSAGDTSTPFSVDASGSSDAEDGIGALFVLWDWESDGVWDTPLDAEKMAEHQYAATGTYTITLKVEDTGGLSDTAAQEVKVISGEGSNTPPTAAFTVNPAEGDTSTAFAVDASGSTDDGTLLEFHWDWESDGMWDTDFTIDKTASHTYTTSGLKTITLEVIDGGGMMDTTNLDVMVTGGSDTTTTTIVIGDNTPPEAVFFVNPPEGDTNTEFEFNATDCNDTEDIPEDLEVRWDFDGDGVWEIEFDIEKMVFFRFDTPGVYPVTIEVKDTGGLTDIAIQEVMVSEVKNCPASAILGESDPRVDTLRQFRDNVLIKSPEGQEIIKLYYQWSPVIVKAMEVDKEFKAEVKEMVDGVLELIE